ncbi:MAG: hypothetical protein WA254_20345 [Candidatus Sulfotelmatobacter sp.]
MSDTLLTVRDVAAILQSGEDAVIRRFAKMDGVIDLGSQSEKKSSRLGRRRYRVLRIPKSVVERYLTGKSGRSVTVEVPERAARRRQSPKWEIRAILNLAKAAKQNNCKNREVFESIADRARVLAAFAPEHLWAEIARINWIDEG